MDNGTDIAVIRQRISSGPMQVNEHRLRAT
jgi:hypothetical protein